MTRRQLLLTSAAAAVAPKPSSFVASMPIDYTEQLRQHTLSLLQAYAQAKLPHETSLVEIELLARPLLITRANRAKSPRLTV